jgi:nitroreductase
MTAAKRIKRIIKKTLYKVLGVKLTRILFFSRYYMDIIEFGERLKNIRQEKKYCDDQMWAAKLRRVVHMIDKGIHLDTYEIGRSANDYQEARMLLDEIKSREVLDDPSVIWARGKLQEYENKQKEYEENSNISVPKTDCSYENMLNAIMTRRSCRNFCSKPVPDDVIEKIIQVISWSPSSCNRQTAKVFLTNDPDMVKKCMSKCEGATCFSEYVPLFFSFCSDARSYLMPKEIVLPYIDISLGIQNCNLIAHSLGLSLTLLTWTQHTEQQEKELRELLGIPEYCQIIVNGVAGYPKAGADVPLRKSLENTMYLRKKG